jgi:hypothetical protein
VPLILSGFLLGIFPAFVKHRRVNPHDAMHIEPAFRHSDVSLADELHLPDGAVF